MVNAKELIRKNEGELKSMLSEARSELQQLRFDVAQGRVKNIRSLRAKKRLIAQILTTLAEQERTR